ncbi:protein binding protein, putative [Ricinus communis]|uniref:RING-type E3 ubiquitin transferase n=1 Tax=Ricinus communis TaxID=3988 RepID=B9R9S4_RICCO|nr:protein binding protein, putative [Ricinus communis]|eukprot:XP_002510949.1 E3 ubiquitin protein ligase RIN2 [Ricinus communis]
MGAGYLAISAACTALSFVGLKCWTELSLEKLKSEGLISENFINPENANRALELLLGSYATIALLASFVFNAFILLNLSLKTIFFAELYPSETRKLMERLVNYVIYKGTFLPLVIPATIFQAGLWSSWLTVLCSLKMFQALARDRLERLNASPSAMPWTYFRVYSVLLLVLSVDFFWIRLCWLIYRTLDTSMFMLLFYEPFSIAFETMQAMLVHGFQLLDIWFHHSAGNDANCQRFKFFDPIAAGSLSEWKGILIRNLGFSLDMATLLMALGHYMHIWWLHGVAFHLVDAVLFLNIRALLSAIIKRVRGFVKLRIALGALHAALPDATSEELRAYDDECAICREPMAKAKKLHCSHLFHLACLRSWLDQGLNEMYSCPTCRKPLFVGRPDNEPSRHRRDVSADEQLARQISEGLDQQNAPTLPAGVFPNQMRNSIEGSPWRSAGLDSSWLHTWQGQGVDGAGPSTAMRSVGLGRVQMMMRHLASVGETYAQTALEDSAWSLWPMNPPQGVASGSLVPPATGGRSAGGTGGLHMRSPSRSANDNVANLLAMAETVREVLPHIPDELILQDLQRTNSVTVTVNNLLQM